LIWLNIWKGYCKAPQTGRYEQAVKNNLYGSLITVSSIQRVELTLISVAERTDPVVRQIIKGRPRWDVVHRIALGGVINVTAIGADIPHLTLLIIKGFSRFALLASRLDFIPQNISPAGGGQ
jgi:hypothetical protein